jgi:Acetyltransferase (GNAT) domain
VIRIDEAAGGAAWNAFLLRHPGSLVYASSGYRSLLVELLGCRDRSLVALEGGEVRGVLPLLELDGILNSLPFYGSNGGVLADTEAAERALAAAYAELALSAGTRAATVVENPFAPARNARYPATHDDARIAQWSDLPATGIEPSAARNVAKARRAGIAVERDAGELARLYELHAQNIEALGGLPKPAAFFELLPRHLEPGTGFDLYVARLDGRTVAALLVLLFNRTAEYFTPAIEHDARSLQPLAAILDVALADAAARGLERWNWGGTWDSQEGVHRFKRKWGARETRYRYHVQVNDEALLDASPAELGARFPGFFVVPYGALRAAEAAR